SGALVASYAHGYGLVSRSDAGGTTAYYDFDQLGNTSELTDAEGAVLDRYVFLPFGEKVASTGNVPNPFTYVGALGVMDGSGDFYLPRNRWYDPSLGRFAQRDPIGLLGGDTNLYTYVLNRPTALTDAAGLEFGDPLTQLEDAVDFGSLPSLYWVNFQRKQ